MHFQREALQVGSLFRRRTPASAGCASGQLPWKQDPRSSEIKVMLKDSKVSWMTP